MLVASIGMVQLDGCPDGFTPIFNGVDLSGWTGDLAGYAVEGGELRCLPSCNGNLETVREYTDFILSFDFKLEAGSNNGIGIRAPEGSNPAYAGMEIQILDDSTPKTAHIRPWQSHGSIYGVIPAKRHFLKPPGEWNHEEITAKGTMILVVLNGTTIVAADVAGPARTGTIDGRSHPGLRRTSGRIHLCGHGDPIAIRNFCIKELVTQ